MADIIALAHDIHRRNYKWWHDRDGNRLDRNQGELLMLAVSELAEAMEGERKDLMDDKLPHRKMAEVEMADTYIRLLDFAVGMGIEGQLQDVEIRTRFVVTFPNRAEALLQIVGRIWQVYGGFDSSLSYALAGIIAYCKAFGYDLDGAVQEKLNFNDTRKDHSWEEREKANGKKF